MDEETKSFSDLSIGEIAFIAGIAIGVAGMATGLLAWKIGAAVKDRLDAEYSKRQERTFIRSVEADIAAL